jgi:signal transduction histidine kinase
MNDQLGHLYGELESASRHKSEFLANMSHELRTPLNAVIGFSEVLQDRLFGDLNDKQAEYVADIHASGRHLLELINDILDLSKIEAGRMDLQVTPFVFSDVAQNAVALSRERATREGIALGLDVDPDIGVIEADARMVKQVLFNLLTNALKFTDRGGHIGVSAHADGDDVVVSVRDDGVGIAPEDQARIFEEFQQVGASRLQEGTGLGLAISRRFIELHGGSLRVESAPGHGSTFTFTIPRTQSTASSPVREDEALMAPQGGTRTQPPDVTSAGDPRRLQER